MPFGFTLHTKIESACYLRRVHLCTLALLLFLLSTNQTKHVIHLRFRNLNLPGPLFTSLTYTKLSNVHRSLSNPFHPRVHHLTHRHLRSRRYATIVRICPTCGGLIPDARGRISERQACALLNGRSPSISSGRHLSDTPNVARCVMGRHDPRAGASDGRRSSQLYYDHPSPRHRREDGPGSCCSHRPTHPSQTSRGHRSGTARGHGSDAHRSTAGVENSLTHPSQASRSHRPSTTRSHGSDAHRSTAGVENSLAHPSQTFRRHRSSTTGDQGIDVYRPTAGYENPIPAHRSRERAPHGSQRDLHHCPSRYRRQSRLPWQLDRVDE